MAGNGGKVTISFDERHSAGVEAMSEDMGTNPTDATRKAVQKHLARHGYVNGGDPTPLETLSLELARFLLHGAAVLLFVSITSPVRLLALALVFAVAGLLFTALYLGEPTFTHQYRRVVEA